MSDSVKLILIRHGESQWNVEQRFTGWADIDLTENGVVQMRAAASAMRGQGIEIDVIFSSVLRRCIRSTWVLLEALERVWVPQILDWRLNERHYGALTGRSKETAVQVHGVDAVHRWRRSYDAQPPPSDAAAQAFIQIDRRYAAVSQDDLPQGESLHQTVIRVREVWRESIAPALKAHRTVAVVGHGNSLRALIMIVEGLSATCIVDVEVGNGDLLVYTFDAAGTLTERYIVAAPLQRGSDIL